MENNYMKFISSFKNKIEENKEDLWFIFNNNKIILKDNIAVPTYIDIKGLTSKLNYKHFLGTYEGKGCYCGELSDTSDLPKALEVKNFRESIGILKGDLFPIAGKGIQIVNWDKAHKYCGKCGALTENKEDERAKICPKCGLINYPRICPAIIVAIIKDGKILLAHNSNSLNNMYSVIAGFVEPGETFEDCVKREVLEEVGIKVKDIKYFGSQPWPFPNSLMVAFTAEYDSGEIKVDGVEITDANWYSVNEFPNIPQGFSIARGLINWFVENNK